MLGAVLGISSQQGSALTGGGLLLVYAFGLSLPFAVLALGSRSLFGRIKGIYPHFPKIKIAGGILIILMGCWMIWGQITLLRAGQNEPVSNSERHPPACRPLTPPRPAWTISGQGCVYKVLGYLVPALLGRSRGFCGIIRRVCRLRRYSRYLRGRSRPERRGRQG